MAIKSFKEIIKNKAYLISQEDRKVFEDGTLQSFFGLGDQDAIEFILYDSADNQLPQANDQMVRYIPMTSKNIGEYILIPEGTMLRQYHFPKEYFIDVERLIQEAGYTNGIFKTQVTLINKRVGSENIYDKLWISEISPSRTEIRVEPLKRGLELNSELYERFKLFTENGDFRDDTIYFLPLFLSKIKSFGIDTMIKSKYGNVFFEKFAAEYINENFDTFSDKIYNTFVESAFNEFSNRISDISDINYGKPKTTAPLIKLSTSDITARCKILLIRAIDFHLKRPTYTTATRIDVKNDPSVDPLVPITLRLN